jgi:zinc protease
MRLLQLSVLTLLTGCAHQSTVDVIAPAEDGGAQVSGPMPLAPDLLTGTLDNGLTYYIRKNTEPENRAVFRLVVDAGSILEDDDQLGLAHVVEHMAFNGTENFEGNELIKTLESFGLKFGAHLNAHTSFDETVYKLTVPTDNADQMTSSMLILHDWADGLAFDGEEIERERGVVLEEWRRSQGSGTRVRDQLIPMMYADSPYPDRLPIGTEASLLGFEHEALVRFYNDWYRPDLMALIAVGDFDPQVMEATIKAQFSDIEGPAEPRVRVRSDVPAKEAFDALVITDPEMTRTNIQMQIKHAEVLSGSHEEIRAGMVRGLAGSILNERLAVVARQADAPFLGAGTGMSRMTPSVMSLIFGAAVVDDGVAVGVEAMMREVRRAVQHGFTEGELQRAVAMRVASMEASLKEANNISSTSKANELVRVYTTGESVSGIVYEAALIKRLGEEITVQEVNAYALSWAATLGRSLSVMMPEKEGVSPPVADDLVAMIGEIMSADTQAPEQDEALAPLMANKPSAGTILSREEVAEIGATKVTLSNGVVVWLKPTDFKDDEVLIAASSPGGYYSVSDEDLVAARTATAIRNRSGVGVHDVTSLGKVLAGKKISLNTSISSSSESLYGSASPDDLEDAFALAHLLMTAPRFDEAAFTNEVQSSTSSLTNRLSTPNAQLSDAFTHMIWGDNFRRKPWTVADLSQMDLEKSAAFYADRFADGDDFTWWITGAFTMEDIEPLLETYVASLPVLEGSETQADDGVRRNEGKATVEVRAGSEPKASVQIAFHKEASYDSQSRLALKAAKHLLSTRLREVLREDLSGVYGVGVRASIGRFPVEMATGTINFGCNPERVDELTAATFDVIKSLQTEDVDSQYLENFKEQERRSWETARRQNSYWQGVMTHAFWSGHPLSELAEEEGRLTALNAEDVRAALTHLFTPDVNRTAVLLPKE